MNAESKAKGAFHSVHRHGTEGAIYAVDGRGSITAIRPAGAERWLVTVDRAGGRRPATDAEQAELAALPVPPDPWGSSE